MLIHVVKLVTDVYRKQFAFVAESETELLIRYYLLYLMRHLSFPLASMSYDLVFKNT